MKGEPSPRNSLPKSYAGREAKDVGPSGAAKDCNPPFRCFFWLRRILVKLNEEKSRFAFFYYYYYYSFLVVFFPFVLVLFFLFFAYPEVSTKK